MGIPLLERNIDALKRCGVREVILSTGYKADCISQHFKERHIDGVKITYVCEDTPLGTGGAIKNCQKYLNDTFLVFNSDILCNMDLKDLVAWHREKGADATIAVTRVQNPSSYGVIEFGQDGIASSFTEKPKPGEEKSDYINAGVYVFEPKILDLIPAGKAVSVEKEIFPAMLKNRMKIAVYTGEKYWIDIGTPEKYMQAHQDIFEGRCLVPENNFLREKVYGLSNVEIHPTAKIRGPVWFGRNVRIGANVMVGPNVVIGDNFQTGRGCLIRNSVIWSGVSVGSGVDITHSVVTSGCRIESGVQCVNTVYSQESKRPFVI